MNFLLPKNILRIIAVCSVLFFAGCNSDSNNFDEDRPPADTNNDTVSEGVVGPLDAIQAPLDEAVLGQLAAALSETPLEGTVDCISQAVVIDLLDVVDALAVALQDAATSGDPITAFNAAAENIQFAITELTIDLPGALTALAGDDCNTGNGGFLQGRNPLSGGPLAPLGDLLAPILVDFSGNPEQDIDLESLADLVHQLNLAFAEGTAQIPAEAKDAPILGGLLTTLGTAFQDLDNTLQPLSMYEGEAAAAELETTLTHLLNNILTEVVPLNFIEQQADQEGLITGPLTEAIATVVNGVRLNLLDQALPPLADALDGPLAMILDPVENSLLPNLLGPLTEATEALAGNGNDGPTGTPLDLLLGPVTNLLTGPVTNLLTGLGDLGNSDGGPTGTPLDLILAPLLNAASGGGGCPFAGTPLNALSTITDAFLP